jgi:hypothetical protein
MSETIGNQENTTEKVPPSNKPLDDTNKYTKISEKIEEIKITEKIDSFMEELHISKEDAKYLTFAEKALQEDNKANLEKDFFELINEDPVGVQLLLKSNKINALLKESQIEVEESQARVEESQAKTNESQIKIENSQAKTKNSQKNLEKKTNAEISKDQLQAQGYSNTEIISILLAKHNSKEIQLSKANQELLLQWQTLLSEPLIPAEIRASLPQMINGSGIKLFSIGAFEDFVTTNIFESTAINDFDKQKIAERLHVPYLRQGSDLKEFAKKYAEEHPGESFDFRGKKAKYNPQTKELELQTDRVNFTVAPGISDGEIGERMNYTLVADLFSKYKLQPFWPQKIRPNGLHDQNEELPPQNLRRTKTILALLCPEHRRGEILSPTNLKRINHCLKMFRKKSRSTIGIVGGRGGGIKDLKELGILDEKGKLVQEKFYKALFFAGVHSRNQEFSNLKEYLDDDSDKNQKMVA